MKRDDEMTSQRFNKTIERKKEIIKAAMQLFSEKDTRKHQCVILLGQWEFR